MTISPPATACNNGIANKVYPVDLIVTPTVHRAHGDRIGDFHVMFRKSWGARVIRAF